MLDILYKESQSSPFPIVHISNVDFSWKIVGTKYAQILSIRMFLFFGFQVDISCSYSCWVCPFYCSSDLNLKTGFSKKKKEVEQSHKVMRVRARARTHAHTHTLYRVP